MVEEKDISSIDDLLAQATVPYTLSLDFTAASKGVDNYRIDVELSPTFVFKSSVIIADQVKRMVSGNKLVSSNSEEISDFRARYTDMMRVTLHRNKIDLTPGQIKILQFAVVKFILQRTRLELDNYEDQLDEVLAQQRRAATRGLLATQAKLQWFRKHRDAFMFRINRLILRQCQREENNQLKMLRDQILGDDLSEATNIMFNPLLYARSPQEPVLLLEYYALWPKNGSRFAQLNSALESELASELPQIPIQKLNGGVDASSAQNEIYDEFGGLFAIQSYMGAAEDQKDNVTESFSWLDQPGNIRLLFDEKYLNRQIQKVKNHDGFRAQWSLRSHNKEFDKLARKLRKNIASNTEMKKMMAAYQMRDKFSQQDFELIEVEDAVSIVAGIDSKKLLTTIDPSKEGAAVLSQKLNAAAAEYEDSRKKSGDELFVKLLTDISRYRAHLKYYRFAQRVFNRISVVTDEEQLRLARAGGQLFRLLDSEEVKESANKQPDILHHTILKADVRGSTSVTQELVRQELNPASYFSMRFFNPINERLEIYGAVKVFIEGDAVILGTYEYENNPTQWYSVSRACGMAKDMLDIINSKNTNSAQTGLPSLEIGIGICYSDEMPLFLFDEDRPIMISSAIGDADRMSSCSWRLRGSFDSGDFNVEVLELDEEDREKGEKGQKLIRYNVNGILLDDAAFAKLRTEIKLTRINVKSRGKNETVFVGQFPDVQGKERHLVIRQGIIGLWRDEEVVENPGSDAVFYEVLPHSRFANQIISLAEKQAGRLTTRSKTR